MRIPLTQGRFAIIDDVDFPLISSYKWYFNHRGYANSGGKQKDMKREKSIIMHRLIMNAPEGLEVDHINYDKLDNRRSNLRLCNHSQNVIHGSSSTKSNKSGYRGVVWFERGFKHWKAHIRINTKVRKNLGVFKTKEEAALKYNEAALKYHGDFAKLNIFV